MTLQHHRHHPRTPNRVLEMLILSSLVELDAVLTTLQICPSYNLRIPHDH